MLCPTRFISRQKFSCLSAENGAMEQWEFTKNEAKKHDVSLELTDVTSEPVPINTWMLQNEEDTPVIHGVATISKKSIFNVDTDC